MAQYINNLSPRQQQIIHLFYIEQRKYDDICKIMGINYQSVRNLMHRSMSRLKEMAAKIKHFFEYNIVNITSFNKIDINTALKDSIKNDWQLHRLQEEEYILQ